jgi:hypothetical protein
LDFQPNGKYLASADQNGFLIIWDLMNMKEFKKKVSL